MHLLFPCYNTANLNVKNKQLVNNKSVYFTYKKVVNRERYIASLIDAFVRLQ